MKECPVGKKTKTNIDEKRWANLYFADGKEPCDENVTACTVNDVLLLMKIVDLNFKKLYAELMSDTPEIKVESVPILVATFDKVEKIVEGSLDLIPSPSVNIQILCGKFCLRCRRQNIAGCC
jgi:hypothetical protein